MGIFTLPDIKTLQVFRNWNSVIWIEDKQKTNKQMEQNKESRNTHRGSIINRWEKNEIVNYWCVNNCLTI